MSGSTDREAAVRLTLDGSQFMVTMRRVGDAAEAEQKKAAKEADRWTAGINKAKDAVKDLGGKLKDAVGMAVSFGGAFSLGKAAHEVINLEAAHKSLAFRIKAGTGAVVDWQTLAKENERVAHDWKRSNEEVGATVQSLYDDIGDIEFAQKGANTIAKTATALRKDMALLTPIVGALNEKFGVTADEMDDALTAAVSLASKGGVSLEDMADKLNTVGASAKLAGLEGQDGFQRLIGLLNIADGSLGGLKKSVAGVGGLLEQIADPDMAKKLKQTLGVDLKKGEGDAITKIISKTRGDKDKLAKVFGGEQLKFLVDLGKTYAEAFDQTEGKIKDKTAAGLEAFNAALNDAGRSVLTSADIEAEATDAMKDPARELQSALNILHEAVAQPEMIEAIHEVAKAMPELAKFLAVFLKFAAKNPLLAAGGVIGGKALLGFAQGAITANGPMFGKGATKEAGEGIAKAAAGSGAWGIAGKAIGAVAAAAVAYEIGKAIIDNSLDSHFEGAADLEDARRNADIASVDGNATTAEKKKALKDLQQQIGREEKNAPDMLTEGLGALAGVVEPGIESPSARHQRGLQQAREKAADLEAQIARAENPTIGPVAFDASDLTGRPPAGGGGSRVAMPGKNGTKIENEDAVGSAIARALSRTTLKVEVNGGGMSDGSRGPIMTPNTNMSGG